ncbi:roadblock/LC7 domain-containing protein [Desulfuromonas sp. CSMB_57]|jgi:predicted regulator of Ras-like GTPase activity (Roadblock/LC7/MglB family)|uniref:roadblock/LC7 domain-containing protein n=1 Tax=Desulfuromonas sp. CSMB_57 TaxID=2807629 RepID=UPI001CD37116|nr:roadblock/LC7 domain-containing protein [Desulfuromonas sp. CSMB_57]
MPFKVVLGELLASVPGAEGAIIADWEGEAVDQVGCMEAFDLQVLGAYKGIILNNLRIALQRSSGDDLQEVVIGTERTRTVVLPITADYFLVLTGLREALLGRALFAARSCVEQLRSEFS